MIGIRKAKIEDVDELFRLEDAFNKEHRMFEIPPPLR